MAKGDEEKFDPWTFVDEDYEQFFMAASNKWNHGAQVGIRCPPETVAGIRQLIDSRETPYKSMSDFVRDSITKNFLWWQKKGALVGAEWQEWVQMEVALGQHEWRRRQIESRRGLIESTKERLEACLMARDKAGFDEALEQAGMDMILMAEPWAGEYSGMVEGYRMRTWE